MDRGAWQATVHRIAKSWTRLSDFTSLHFEHIATSCDSHVRLFATRWTAAHQSSLFLTISWSLLNVKQTDKRFELHSPFRLCGCVHYSF